MQLTPTPSPRRASEAQLIRRAQSGDRRALETLLRTHAPMVERICRSMCGKTGHYDDLVQETYLTILRNFGAFRCEAAFSTWVYAIARTSRCRVVQRTATRPAAGGYDRAERPASDRARPDIVLAGNEIGTAIDRALSRLSALDRTVMTLYYVHQRPLQEVADRLGLSEPAARSRLHRARRTIRERLRDLHRELQPDFEAKAA